MNKLKYLVIALLLVFVVSTSYAAFTAGDLETGTIVTKEMSAKFLNNADLLAKVEALDSSITSVDKTTDLVRVNNVPSVSLSSNNLVSTKDSSVPIYLWVNNGIIYYYTSATSKDLNNI